MTLSHYLKEYLEAEGISFEILEHPTAYTSLEIAGSQHVPGRNMLKSVLVEADNQLLMCVLPAIRYLDLYKLQDFLGVQDVKLAGEMELARLFPFDEVGAEPPFAHFAELPLYADKILDENEYIYFNGGSHMQLIKMKWQDYKKLAKPILVDFGIAIQKVK